jgi:hypothetical protein
MSSTTTELQHSSATAMGDTTTKSEVLEILDLIQEGIESSVYFRFGKRQKKLKLLSRVRQKVLASTDQLSLARAMEGDAVSDVSCMPALRRKALTKGKEEVGELRLQVTSALKFLNSRARRTRKESLEAVKEGEEVKVVHIDTDTGDNKEDATPPDLDETYDDELSEDSTADAASGNYDGDTEKDAMSNTGLSSCESTNDGDNGDDDDDLFNGQQSSHVITTCSVQDENGPLGFSITTWRKHTLKESSGRGLVGQTKGARTGTTGSSTKSNPNDEEEELAKDASATEESSDSQNIKLGGGNGTESDEALEQVSVRFGKGGIVHASRTRSVRFKGIKPSTEDNIFRAKELLERYRS